MSNFVKSYSCTHATINISLLGSDQMIVSSATPEKLKGKMIICEYDNLLIEYPKVKKFINERVCSFRCSLQKQKSFPCSE